MDAKYQDIIYVDKRLTPIPLYHEVAWGIRCVHVITISFGDKDIVILYRDEKNEYHKQVLKKLPYHELQIS